MTCHSCSRIDVSPQPQLDASGVWHRVRSVFENLSTLCNHYSRWLPTITPRFALCWWLNAVRVGTVVGVITQLMLLLLLLMMMMMMFVDFDEDVALLLSVARLGLMKPIVTLRSADTTVLTTRSTCPWLCCSQMMSRSSFLRCCGPVTRKIRQTRITYSLRHGPHESVASHGLQITWLLCDI